MPTKPTAPLLLKFITPLFRANQKKFANSSRKNVFILSTGRTGTTYLAELLGKDTNVLGLHEPKPSRILRLWGNAHFAEKASQLYLKTALYNKRRKIYRLDDDRIYVESNPYLVGFADVLGDVFDKPIIIHVVRDPRDYIKSLLNHGNATGIKLIFNNYVPFWFPKIKDGTNTNQNSLLHRTANYWAIVNQHLVEIGQNNPNYHLIKYEELFDRNSAGIKKLAQIIGLDASRLAEPVSQKGVNKSRYQALDSWDEWSDEECRDVNELCQPLMDQLGYGQEAKWRERVR